MIFRLKTAYIENWRKLSHLSPLSIGNRITLISGQNGVGKSNLLSLIASGSGIPKPKGFNSAIKNFQPDFDNFFIIDEKEDYKNYSIILEYISIDENNELSVSFYKDLRTKNDTRSKRGIRIIPTTKNYNNNFPTKSAAQAYTNNCLRIGNDARVPIPTLFLSISRLYPLGEGETDTKKLRSKSHDIYLKYQEWYNFVLPNSIKADDDPTMLEIDKNATSNKSYYLPIIDTTPLSQSVGQDNLNCIISALINFYELSLTNDYFGGILCIDEIDVSLHPDAQQRLIQLLDKLSGELNLQIIISSHSLVIIKEILKRLSKSPEDYSMGYLINNTAPFFKRNLTYEAIKKDLFLNTTTVRPKLKVYFEDEHTQNIFDLLLQTHISFINDEYDHEGKSSDTTLNNISQLEKIPVHLGCTQLIGLTEADSYFTSTLIVLDGDASMENGKQFQWNNVVHYLNDKIYPSGSRHLKNNILCLPSIFPPELFLYRIINDLVENERIHTNFWREIAEYPDLDLNTAQSVREKIIVPLTNVQKDVLKDKYDVIFKFVKQSHILSYYYRQDKNKTELDNFISSFNKKSSILLTKLKSRFYQD